MLLGAALAIAPVVAQNWRVTGVPLVQAYGGLNFYLGNTPSSDGAARARPGEQWDRLEGEASRYGTTRNDQDRYFVRKTLSEIVANPIEYVRLLATKLSWGVQNEELLLTPRPTLDALALEYKRDYGTAYGDLEITDLMNNPTANGVCRVLANGT